MKRKIRKFNEGGDTKEYNREDKGIFGNTIKYREDSEGRKYTASPSNPMMRTPSEQRYYSVDDVKSKLSGLFGGKKEDSSSKFDELESVGGASRRPRTIEEQIGRKAEDKPAGKLYVNQEYKEDTSEPATKKKVTSDVNKSKIDAAAPATKKAKPSMDAGIPKDTKATRMPSGYENLDPRSPQEKSRGKKQGVIQYEKGRSMSDWSRNLGKRPESDEEDDKPSKSIFSTKSPNRSYKSGGKVKSASARADGCAIRGKTRA